MLAQGAPPRFGDLLRSLREEPPLLSSCIGTWCIRVFVFPLRVL